MIDRHHVGTDGVVPVTFRLDTAADRVDLLGEFNEWAPLPMERGDDDVFSATIDLEAGQSYRFRYLINGSRWENDWAADAYVPNEFGGDDSLVDLRDLPGARRRAFGPAPVADGGDTEPGLADPRGVPAAPGSGRRSRQPSSRV